MLRRRRWRRPRSPPRCLRAGTPASAARVACGTLRECGCPGAPTGRDRGGRYCRRLGGTPQEGRAGRSGGAPGGAPGRVGGGPAPPVCRLAGARQNASREVRRPFGRLSRVPARRPVGSVVAPVLPRRRVWMGRTFLTRWWLMLVTVTPRFRVHRDEVLCALVRGNTLVLRFASMKSMRLPIDDLTDEAREWLLPALAPREIVFDERDDVEGEEAQLREDEAEQTREVR